MTDQFIQKLITTAKQEIGYLEKKSNNQLDSKTANAGDKNWTKYARDLDNLHVYDGKKNGYAWCAVYVMWCIVQTFGLNNALKITNQPLKGYGASCSSGVQYYKRANRFFTKNPQPGDQIFFSPDKGKTFNHTGLVTAVNGGKVDTIEGNTSSTPGVVPNGGCVREKSYDLNYSKIGGYGRPMYELLQEDEEDMTQEKFNEMMAKYLETLNKKPASNYQQDSLAWAQENGIMTGDASGNFMAQRFLTRGEFITVLKRFYDKFIKK